MDVSTTDRVSPIGHWSLDEAGLPTYRLEVDVPVVTTTPAGAPYPLEPDPYALIGNDGLSLFVHASGRFVAMSGERGWVRLNAATDEAASNGAALSVTRDGATTTHELLGEDGVAASSLDVERELGCGFARYAFAPLDGVAVTRTLGVAPSTASGRGAAAFVVGVRLTNTGSEPADVEHVETVLSHPFVGKNTSPDGSEPPFRFVTTAEALAGGQGVVATSTATSDDPGILTGLDEPNRYNLYPPALALLASPSSQVPVSFEQRVVASDAVELSARARVTLEPGESRDVVVVVGLLSPDDDVATLVAFASSLPDDRTFRAGWATALAAFEQVEDPTLRSELTWDGHAILAMATWSAYHGHTVIPQGMTYDYVIEMFAAPRDHLQHAMAAAYFAPHLARETILYTLCKMTYQGEIKYMDFGNGDTSNSAWNTSDQQLYLFQTLGEYLRITGDTSILEATTAYLPREASFLGSTLDKLERAFAYLRDEVSTGPHGLVRLMNSDWSDMVFVDLSVHRYFGTAESQMNTAMAMAVMPTLVEQLDAYGAAADASTAERVARLTTSMNLYLARITAAMLRDMEGRTFARRVWLDRDTALGDATMDLEPQAFLLQAPDFPVERKRALWEAMSEQLLAGEVLGPRQREKPVVGGLMDPGVSENGGFWYALAGQTVVGVATFDTDAALGLVDRLTLRSFGAHYPDYWVGQWTGPDTINAEYCGDLAGLPRPDNDGLWSKFAAYCAHVHAWPVYGWFRTRDLA